MELKTIQEKKEKQEKYIVNISQEHYDIIRNTSSLDRFFTNNKTNNFSDITDSSKTMNALDKYQNEILIYLGMFQTLFKPKDTIYMTECYKSIIENSNKLFSVNSFVKNVSNLICDNVDEDLIKPNNLYAIPNYNIKLIDPNIMVSYLSPSIGNSVECLKSNIDYYFKLLNEFIIHLYCYKQSIPEDMLNKLNKLNKFNFKKKNINNPNIVNKVKDHIKIQKFGDVKQRKDDKKEENKIDFSKMNINK